MYQHILVDKAYGLFLYLFYYLKYHAKACHKSDLDKITFLVLFLRKMIFWSINPTVFLVL